MQTAAQCAEARIRTTEAAVASEVESRMAAASCNRIMWPRALREEVGRIEARVEGLQAMLGSAQAESERQAAAGAAQGRMRVGGWMQGTAAYFAEIRGWGMVNLCGFTSLHGRGFAECLGSFGTCFLVVSSSDRQSVKNWCSTFFRALVNNHKFDFLKL